MFTDSCAIRKIDVPKGAPFETPPVPGSTCGVIVESRHGIIYEKKTVQKNKDKVVAFRLSSEDFIQFEEKLAASNMKKSEFFREVF